MALLSSVFETPEREGSSLCTESATSSGLGSVSPGSHEFAGPVIATIDAFASVWSDFEPDIRAIETMIDAGSSTWTLFDGDRDALARRYRRRGPVGELPRRTRLAHVVLP